MSRPTLPAVLPVPVPALELWLGLLWWTVGSTAFGSGPGTAVLAVGLMLMVWLYPAVRRIHGVGAPLPHGGRNTLLRRAGVTIGLVVALSMALAYPGYGELAAPVACVLFGFVLARLSGLLSRSVTVAGVALMALGATGGLLALDTPGQFYGQGLVGLGAAVLLWLAGGYRTRVLAGLGDGGAFR